jgi:hypothetical protein
VLVVQQRLQAVVAALQVVAQELKAQAVLAAAVRAAIMVLMDKALLVLQIQDRAAADLSVAVELVDQEEMERLAL